MKVQRGDSLFIGIFGRRNSGKSSLINAVTKQEIAIVSAVPGTTTDPVFKAMELLPVGPVTFIDTAGIDDTDGTLGEERVKRTERILAKTDLALLVIPAEATSFAFEDQLIASFDKYRIEFVTIINKADTAVAPELLKWLGDRPATRISALKKEGIEELKKAIIAAAPKEWEPPLLRDLFEPGDAVLLITPIDRGAPKGRMIMPQAKAIREVLDGHGIVIDITEYEIEAALKALKVKPVLAVTDSQAFEKVAPAVPEDIPLTGFSVLSIRQKGELRPMVEGVMAVKSLKPGDKVLIAESCTHHPMEDDIGRLKIPRWLSEYVGGPLDVHVVPGYDYPDDLSTYKLVVHCGGCTLNRREVLRRQAVPAKFHVPMTNYGILIAFLRGAFPRALKPFPEVADLIII
ncbi:MAG TPA: [FeFe] hydrogenase H-cluster maturation GTPase HydF [bacterium]|nr:[FeFe] hydrogenase H-cluster maturation GTPase HydF [bacterium]